MGTFQRHIVTARDRPLDATDPQGSSFLLTKVATKRAELIARAVPGSRYHSPAIRPQVFSNSCNRAITRLDEAH
jgi:hypothetical protein